MGARRKHLRPRRKIDYVCNNEEQTTTTKRVGIEEQTKGSGVRTRG
jgi:hypothetical protein